MKTDRILIVHLIHQHDVKYIYFSFYPFLQSTTRSHDSDETDEIAKWLSSRQLIPVNSQQQSQHSHRPFQHQQQSLTTNSRSHSCVRTNHLSAITNTTTTTTTAGVSLYATQNPSNKSVHVSVNSFQSYNSIYKRSASKIDFC